MTSVQYLRGSTSCSSRMEHATVITRDTRRVMYCFGIFGNCLEKMFFKAMSMIKWSLLPSFVIKSNRSTPFLSSDLALASLALASIPDWKSNLNLFVFYTVLYFLSYLWSHHRMRICCRSHRRMSRSSWYSFSCHGFVICPVSSRGTLSSI
jgi:hypothetical protein